MDYKYSLVAVVGVVLLAVVSAQQEVWTREDYPNPQTDPYACGRYSRRSYVCDPNHIIQEEEANQLDLLIEGVMNDTRCPCSTFTCRTSKTGFVIGVALVKKIQDTEEVDPDGDIQDIIDANLQKSRLFAYTMEQTWGLGNCDEDVIIMYSLDDNALYTMTGEAARRKLRDSFIGEIAMAVRNNFGPGKPIFDGLKQMILEYREADFKNFVQWSIDTKREVFLDNYVLPAREPPVVAALTDAAPHHLSTVFSVTLLSLLAYTLS